MFPLELPRTVGREHPSGCSLPPFVPKERESARVRAHVRVSARERTRGSTHREARGCIRMWPVDVADVAAFAGRYIGIATAKGKIIPVHLAINWMLQCNNWMLQCTNLKKLEIVRFWTFATCKYIGKKVRTIDFPIKVIPPGPLNRTRYLPGSIPA